MLKILITIIFIYFLSIMLFRLVILLFGFFVSRMLKAKLHSSAKKGFSTRKKYDSEDVIDAEFKEVKK